MPTHEFIGFTASPTLNKKTPLSYQDAGVSIDAGNALVQRIKSIAARTRRSEVLTGLGGFAALYELPLHRYQQPILVSTTDGVGTKLRLAIELNRHSHIGIDLVAMCVNDLVVCGAEPVLFLDYYATGQLNVDIAASVIEGIGRGCEMAGAALVGGETAEMPGMYSDKDYDLAGFCVGLVDKKNIIDGKAVKAGDVLIGLPSSGPHSNGYSLIRKIIEVSQCDLNAKLGDKTLADILLEPTRIYVKPLLELFKNISVKALAHITGGGLLENIPRVLPENCQAHIEKSAWKKPLIFDWLQEQGNVADLEMFRTFNCGIGMVLCVAKENASTCIQQLNNLGEPAFVIGSIESLKDNQPHVVIV